MVIRSCWFFTVLVCSLEWDVPYPAPLSPLCVCVYYTSVISLSFPSLSLFLCLPSASNSRSALVVCRVSWFAAAAEARSTRSSWFRPILFIEEKQILLFAVSCKKKTNTAAVCVCVQWSLGKKIRKNGVHLLFHAGRYDGWVQLNLFAAYSTFFRFFFFFLIWAFPRQPNGTKRTVDHEYTSKYVYNVLLHRWSANPAEM